MNVTVKRYLYLAIGTLMMLLLGLIYAWSIFRAPFSASFQSWTASNLSMTFTISMCFFCIGGFVSGKMLAVLSNKIVVIIAAALLFTGFFAISRLDVSKPQQSLMILYIFYGVFCGTGVGMGYNAIISTITKWFPDRTGFASGVLLMGFGFGGMVLGIVVNSLVAAVGLFSTFVILAIADLTILVTCSFFLKKPEPSACITDHQAVVVAKRCEYTPLQMLSTPVFWMFFLWNVIIASAGLLVINSAATIAVSFGAPAVLGLIVSVFNGVGRISIGTLLDKIGRAKTMYINSTLLMCAGLFLLAGAVRHNTVLIFAGLLFIGVSYGGSPALSSAVVNLFFGQKNYAVNFSIHNFLVIPAAIIGPLVSGSLQEYSNGSYISTFAVIIAFAAIAFVIHAFLNRACKKWKQICN